MPYKQKFEEEKKPFGMDSGTWDGIKAALDSGANVEWEFSSFNDPGDDWEAVLVNGRTVYKRNAY